MARVEFDVENADELAQRRDDAVIALEGIEAKHVAGGGSTDLSRELDIVRSFVDAAGSVVNAAKKQADDQRKAEEAQAAKNASASSTPNK